jgi:hypothetical protein
MLTAVAVTKGWCHWEYQEALHPTFPMCYYSLGPWKSKHNIPVRHLRLCLPLWLESWLWHWWMGLINLGPHQHLPRVFSLLPCLRAICVDLISCLWGQGKILFLFGALYCISPRAWYCGRKEQSTDFKSCLTQGIDFQVGRRVEVRLGCGIRAVWTPA